MHASLSGKGNEVAPAPHRTSSFAALADRWVPKLVLSPSLLISLVFVYGFIAVTGYMSFSKSRLMPNFKFAGIDRYVELFHNDVWWTSAKNLGWFAIPFIAICVALGLLLAILLDQKIRNEGALRAIFLYPMALSYIVTGTAWQWILNPGLGIEKIMQDWGWTSFSFNWLGDPDKAIFCIVIAAVWQSTGFCMALFLAGLRGVDAEIFKAAQVDGATLPTIYRKIVIPSMRPVFFSVLLILCHIAIKTFDLVVALTAGGPGNSSSLPAIFMYVFSFNRGQLGVGAASSMMMLATVVAVLVPLMYMESRSTRNAA
ncbi:carbohydrate ABC transporter membrane protein 1 (CUT1 family) [Trinickia symbiotica]|uniref:Sugar ABC transporter permease n=1 Tax=Trinickia symbiotica TaxID=863227 RepID=A0A2N7X664_9BURK|nr:sugar ABC transporter permease [Trinickia symbiotica]PMS37061.1 sugar ABC transporter permease [Trinickia symbiotica]PPK43001.1 carbohydrate ABC transporter membrane protein 1 (CUT1 family) [Trinickia symbiotica]